MAAGRVVVAHHSESVRRAIVEGLSARGVICAVARQAAEAVLVQAAMRADAVFMDGMWMLEAGGMRLLAALQRDVMHPYVLVCGSRISRAEAQTMRRMGACAVACEEETDRILEMIERNLICRARTEEDGNSALCSALSRLFSDYGLPCHLRGYRYLMFAVCMLASGEGSVEQLGQVYSRASVRFGCSAAAVDRGISQAVHLCSRRCCHGDIFCVKDFLLRVLEETRHVSENPAVRPRVAVFSGEERGIF